jgi:hypothetical protein
MKVSPEPKKEVRSAMGKIATAVAFALVIGSLGVSAARADEYRGDDRGRHGNQYRDNDDRGYRGPSYAYAPQPDYYYAPQPDYYYAPEPNYYYESRPTYAYDAPRSQGFNLFFGF